MDDCHGVHSATDRYLTHVQYVVDQLRAGKLTSHEAINLHSVHSTDLLVACTDAFVDRLHEITRPAIAAARAKARRAGECRHPDGPVFPLTDPCPDAGTGPGTYVHPARHPDAAPAANSHECSGCGCVCLHPSPQEGALCSCACDDCDCPGIAAELEMG